MLILGQSGIIVAVVDIYVEERCVSRLNYVSCVFVYGVCGGRKRKVI